MMRIIRRFLCCAAAVLLGTAGRFPAGAVGTAAAEASAGWTVMVYMIGSDLESGKGLAERDLAEMQEAVREDTALLVMTGGAAEWTNGMPSDACCLWRITGDGRELLDSWDGRMTDPQMLSRLLEAGMKPESTHTALVFWDHGFGAVEGFGRDEQSGSQGIGLPSIAGALEESGLRGHPLSVIGFDACLMAGCETVAAFAPYAGYLLASEETEPPEGWNYAFLSRLDPSADGETFGRYVIGDYTAYFDKLYTEYPGSWQPYTLSLTDLTQTGILLEQADRFFADLTESLLSGRFSDISRAREAALAPGRKIPITSYDLADLSSLAEKCRDFSESASLLESAVETCVIARGGSEEDLCGLSVYFPHMADEAYSRRWQEKLSVLSLPDGWQAFMRGYSAKMLGESPEPGAADPTGRAYSVTLNDEQLAEFRSAKYYILCGNEGDEMILLHAGNDYTLEDSTLTVHFDNRLPAISAVSSDGTEEAAVPPVTLMDCRDAEDAYYRAPVVAVMKKNADSLTGEVPEQRLIYLRFRRDLSGGVWETMTAMDRSRSDNGMAAEEFTTGRQEIRTEDILELMVTWPVSMPTGDSSASWAAWTPRAPYYDFVDMSNGFRLKEISADELEIGPVWVQIVMTDTHNREHALTLVPVQPGE